MPKSALVISQAINIGDMASLPWLPWEALFRKDLTGCSSGHIRSRRVVLPSLNPCRVMFKIGLDTGSIGISI
jgi:hypothetical protein